MTEAEDLTETERKLTDLSAAIQKSLLDTSEEGLEQYDSRVSAYESTLTARFSKLDNLVSTWNGYSSSLTSIFKSLQRSSD